MINVAKKIVPKIGLFAAISACSGAEKSAVASNNDPALVGTWKGVCQSFPDDGDGSYISERVEIKFTSDLAAVSLHGFRGENCPKTANDKVGPWYIKTATSKYKTEASNSNGIGNIDYELVKLSVTPGSDNEAASLNEEKQCGYTQWKKGVEVDVTDLPCDEDDKPFKKGDLGYDIYQISGGKLRMGLNADRDPDSDIGRKPSTRPSELTDDVYSLVK